YWELSSPGPVWVGALFKLKLRPLGVSGARHADLAPPPQIRRRAAYRHHTSGGEPPQFRLKLSNLATEPSVENDDNFD
ncbi:hypothetical protein, partial [Saccharopolyspora sp. NPDC002686]|uniref:hypothetical protein n=1 Tax=Saccharopolyspora sp. NPDC002686 TaxID=3154541 RepID=UPI0033298BDA